MGMRSYFQHEELTVEDWDGLCDYMDRWNETFPNGWINTEAMLDRKNKNVSFASWDDIKLISYWYAMDVTFIHGIAKYIRGEVAWCFESDDETGHITFEDNKAIIEIGIMDYKGYSPEQLMDGHPTVPKEELDKMKGFMLQEAI